MSTVSEKSQFRRLVGDYGVNNVTDVEIESYLDDATRECTMDFTDADGVITPVTDFDTLISQYHPEVIVLAAINWWWNRASQLVDRHSKSVGQSSEQSSEKWDRAMQMIQKLNESYETIQYLGKDITMGNLSRFSKNTLTRLGGQPEEDALGSSNP